MPASFFFFCSRCSDDEEAEAGGQSGLLFIPITPEIDEPEESGWGQLEVGGQLSKVTL